MRLTRIAPALGLVVSLSACKKDRCDGVLSEFIPGVTVTGFSLASNGLGYLSTNIAFGDCFGSYDARIFRIDANARTDRAIPVDFFPGKVSVSADGQYGLAIPNHDPDFGYPSAFKGYAWLSGNQITEVPLDDSPLDVRAGDGGWVVSAGNAGSYWVLAESGVPILLDPGPSPCGAPLGSGFAICHGNELRLLDASGNVTSTLVFSSDPFVLSTASGTSIVLWGTSASLVRAGATTIAVPLSRGVLDAWLSDSGRVAFVAGRPDAYWIDSESGTAHPLGLGKRLVDTAETENGSYAFMVWADTVSWCNDFFDLQTDIQGEAFCGPALGAAVERSAGNVFVTTEGQSRNRLRVGDHIEGFFNAFRASDPASAEALGSWDLTIDRCSETGLSLATIQLHGRAICWHRQRRREE